MSSNGKNGAQKQNATPARMAKFQEIFGVSAENLGHGQNRIRIALVLKNLRVRATTAAEAAATSKGILERYATFAVQNLSTLPEMAEEDMRKDLVTLGEIEKKSEAATKSWEEARDLADLVWISSPLANAQEKMKDMTAEDFLKLFEVKASETPKPSTGEVEVLAFHAKRIQSHLVNRIGSSGIESPSTHPRFGEGVVAVTPGE